MITKDWSVKGVQDMSFDEGNEWDRTSMHASDATKCPSGIYLALKGEKETTPIDPKSLRRMEIGKIIEENLCEKLRSQGIFLGGNMLIEIPEFGIHCHPDAIVISPENCTAEAKEMIDRKKMIFSSVRKLTKELKDLTTKEKLNLVGTDIMKKITTIRLLNDEDERINKKLLEPNPENSLMVLEVKSIARHGFEWRQKDNQPMEDHKKQLMTYYWKLREKYPWLLADIIYIDTTYQEMLEFRVEFDPEMIEDLKKRWQFLKDAVESGKKPDPAPDVILNPKTNRWQVNFQADWCRYHIKCTDDPNWKEKAIKKVFELNKKK